MIVALSTGFCTRKVTLLTSGISKDFVKIMFYLKGMTNTTEI